VLIVSGISSRTASTSTPSPPPSSQAPVGEWQIATPESEGFDSAVLATGLEAFGAGGALAGADGASPLHSVLIVRHDRLVLEAYVYPYDGSTYHDVRSVTKSVTTTLIGIAAEQGLLDLDAPLLSFFPDRPVANHDERKDRITVRHLASMTSGLDCSAEGGERTLLEMVASDDFVQFALDLRMAREPGEQFSYCSPGMHLLSAILTEATGMTELEFSRANLFEPLGIIDVSWPADAQGYSYGWSELALHPRDAAKLGLLFLHGGAWGGRQVVPAGWLEVATRRQVGTGGGAEEDYGYGWWISRPGEVLDTFRASGDLGQRIIVFPAKDMVLVTNGGGFTLDDVTDVVLDSVTHDWQPLPANPTAAGRLSDVLDGLRRGPAAGPPPSLPPTAMAISRRNVVFGSDAPVRSLRVDFGSEAEATVRLDLVSDSEPRIFAVGLDGRFRSSRAGRPLVARGDWTDATTFVIEINEGPGIAPYSVRLRYDGDGVRLDAISVSGDIELSLTGQLED
jgi:CubicO group peptidase (beta-lactamase class C family)